MDTYPPATITTNTPLSNDQNPVLVSTRHGSGHVGPFFAVMSVIPVLSALPCTLGRFCGSRAEGPDSWYDCLGWCQRRCGCRCRMWWWGEGSADGDAFGFQAWRK